MQDFRGKRRSFSEINVTPFVDVVLVLLIIFMVTAPLMQTGLEIELPETESSELDIETDQFIVTVTAEEKLYINKREYSLDKLKEKLPLILKQRSVKDVYLRADKKATYGFVVKVMAVLKESGVDRLGMITQPLEEEK